MQFQYPQAQQLLREGALALQQGRARDARARFESVVRTSPADPQAWLLLAMACRAGQDPDAEEQAVDRLLTLQPQGVRGLIMKADCRARAGEERLAVNLYKNALRFAEGRNMSQAEVDELRRVEENVRALDARYAAQLEEQLAAAGFGPGTRSPRFAQSLDIMAGRSQVYYQEPTGYYFPGLPQTQYFDTAAFAWVAEIEAATGAVRAELKALLEGGLEGFRPYIRSEENQPRDHPLLDKRDWSALFLCENGRRFDEAIASCPKTWAAVQAAPQAWIERSSPTAMFSLLRAGARIPAHRGVTNTRLTCHLPLIVPPGCRFRVGNEVREWREGEVLIFDDSIEHEAWNDGNEDRVVLIFDIERPELSAQEKAEIAALFRIAIT
ncbi:MAG: aspartyl/asparaginyl beta-hydroxylase domain-containing protein [Sphingomonadaceae bacterium]|nr:aspartyl/asparaginyl beta-hydroxylase domain-containing protein [Sphingomonadaceae bacterium]